MVTDQPSPSFDARAMLAAAWPLFKHTWPGCLPLAVIAVAASGSTQASAVVGAEPRGLAHTGDWWGLYLASVALMLICYGGVLLRQLSVVQGIALRPFDALRLAGRRLPQSVATALPVFGLFGVAWFVVPHSATGAAAALLAGMTVAFWMAFAWPAALAESLGPVAALRRGAALVRGRLPQVALLVAIAFASILVFVLLTGIFLGVVMSIADMGRQPGAVQLAISRLLIALLVALPLVWLSAVWATAYRSLGGTLVEGPRSGQP